jgi:hypothetical protein
MTDQPYPEKFKEQNNIPEPYLAAIGRVAVNWCYLESLMELAIGKLAAFDLNDPRGVILTAHMTWPQKMDVLEALVHALETDYPHLTNKFEATKPLLTQAQKGRNRIVHGQWGDHPEKGIVKVRYSARGKLKYGIDPVSLDEIKGISLDIGNASLSLIRMTVNK